MNIKNKIKQKSFLKIQKYFNKIKLLRDISVFWKVNKNLYGTLQDKFMIYKKGCQVEEQPSRTRFYLISKALGYSYKKIVTDFSNYPNTKISRKLFCLEVIDKFYLKEEYLLCFDITSFSENNYKKKGWAHISENFSIKDKFVNSNLHLLAIIDDNSVVAYQIIKGSVMNFDIINFFNDCLEHIFNKSEGRKINIILDNAGLHKTKYFKNYFTKNNIFLIFTVSRTPILNPIEFFFRNLKKGLRKIYFEKK